MKLLRIQKPIDARMGKNKYHKGFYTFNFDTPQGNKFIDSSYCFPEQNYLTKRYSGKWHYIEFAFQSWALDPCNAFRSIWLLSIQNLGLNNLNLVPLKYQKVSTLHQKS